MELLSYKLLLWPVKIWLCTNKQLSREGLKSLCSHTLGYTEKCILDLWRNSLFPSAEERTQSLVFHILISAEFQEMVQWNRFIYWREELPFTREVQQDTYDTSDFFTYFVMHLSSFLLFSFFSLLQLATLSISTISLLSCRILNLWLCLCFWYLCSSLIVCTVGYFTVRNLVGIEN